MSAYLTPVPLLNLKSNMLGQAGKQAALTPLLESRSMGLSNRRTAMSFESRFGPKLGCLMKLTTVNSWCFCFSTLVKSLASYSIILTLRPLKRKSNNYYTVLTVTAATL